MVELERQHAQSLEPLFAWTPGTMVRSFLDGCMGRGWADDAINPTCATVCVGDFCAVAGNAASPGAEALAGVLAEEEGRPDVIFVPQNEAWAELIARRYPGRTTPITRYAFHHGEAFPAEKLRRLRAALPAGYRLSPIDAALYHRCLASPLADLCSQFAGAEDYAARGLGFCAIAADGTVAGGASSYTVYRGGIEVEVDTLAAHRRRGIAAACAAALILACQKRGLVPAWDAANPASKALAQKLGYRFSHAYPALEVAF